MTKIAILTNARAADQRSMIGYGSLLIDTARNSGFEVVEWRGASLFSLLPLKGRLLKLALNLDRFIVTPLKLLGRKADLVHVVDPGNCVYLPLTRHRQSVVTVHDMIPWLARDSRLVGFVPTRTGKWLMDLIVARLAKVNQLICVSESTRTDVLNFVDVSSENVKVIYIAVFQQIEPSSREACYQLRTKFNLPLHKSLVFHVGRNFYKNRETILKVASRVRATLPETHLVFVGEPSSNERALADQLQLCPHLHVLPQVSAEDMATLYSTAAVLLFPSLYEGFGLPVVEARMCGTPVVCSDAGSLPEVAGPETVMASPNAIEELASACIALIQSGKRPAPERPSKFDPLTWAKAHHEIYNKLLAK